jgi:uncharacterized membrane protein (DUF2068 family)
MHLILQISSVIGITGSIAIYGIARERLWAKWLAIAIHSSFICLATAGLISSLSIGTTSSLFPNFVLLRMLRVAVIIASFAGIALLWQKPKRDAE